MAFPIVMRYVHHFVKYYTVSILVAVKQAKKSDAVSGSERHAYRWPVNDTSRSELHLFCGKSQHEVRKLIAGPKVFICNGCVAPCVGILSEEG